jgi:hypothetical protein
MSDTTLTPGQQATGGPSKQEQTAMDTAPTTGMSRDWAAKFNQCANLRVSVTKLKLLRLHQQDFNYIIRGLVARSLAKVYAWILAGEPSKYQGPEWALSNRAGFVIVVLLTSDK